MLQCSVTCYSPFCIPERSPATCSAMPSSQNEYATSLGVTRHYPRAVVHAFTTVCVHLRVQRRPLLTTNCTRLPSNSASSRAIFLVEIGYAIRYIGCLAMPCVKSLTLTSRTASPQGFMPVADLCVLSWLVQWKIPGRTLHGGLRTSGPLHPHLLKGHRVV
jgi:hypothetical protein